MGRFIGIHLQTGPVTAYAAEPTTTDRAGGILLMHDMWGLDDHIMSVADRLAGQGYHVIAPNLIMGTIMEKRIQPELQQGLYSPYMRERGQAQARLQTMTAPLRSPQMASIAIMRAHACFDYLYNMQGARQNVAVLGFGYGGTHSFSLAIRENRLKALLSYYAPVNYVAYELQHIQCPVMAFYGNKDQQSMASLFKIQKQIQQTALKFTPIVYEGVGASFFNPELQGAYDEESAADSWSRALSFLQANM